MNESESQYKQFLDFQAYVKKQQSSIQDCVDNKTSEPNTSSKLSSSKVPKKRKILLLSHVLVEWVTVDQGDLTILTVNSVLGISPEKIIENSVYNVKFTDKSNGGVYEAKVLAIGTREECASILEIKIKSPRTQKESHKNKSIDNTDATINSLNEKIIELQAIIDRKNNDLEEASRAKKECITKYDLLLNSFSK